MTKKKPDNELTLSGMPESMVVLKYRYQHLVRGKFGEIDRVPDIGDPIDIPAAQGSVTKITETVDPKTGHTVFTIAVLEDEEE